MDNTFPRNACLEVHASNKQISKCILLEIKNMNLQMLSAKPESAYTCVEYSY